MVIIEVGNMGELKSKMVNHVRSAQKWLSRAEQAFESEKDMRGKLDLMLAQAEMQHLHESAIQGKSFSLIKQVVAFSCAAVLFSGGIGGAYFYFHHHTVQTASPIQTAERKVSSPMLAPEASFDPNRSSSPTAVSGVDGDASVLTAAAPGVPQQAVVSVQKAETAKIPENPVAVDKENAVPQIVKPEDMQKLIRAAGKSLRGQ
jgi:hypothetical protein